MRYTLFLLSLLFASSAAFAQELRIVNVRVGQGDATLIQGPPVADGSRINVLFDAGNRSGRDGGNILRAVLKKYDVDRLDFFIASHDDADHIGGIAFGDSHGTSIVLGFDNAPGCEGDDDGDGITDWVGQEPNFNPDPEELLADGCDDLPILNWVDYGEVNMRTTDAIRKYNGFANAMGTRHSISTKDEVNNFEIDLGGGARMVAYAGNGFVRGRDERVPRISSANEKSLSFLLSFGDFDFLISGDLIGKGIRPSINAKMEQAVAEALERDGVNVDILHVNHHGADNGSAQDFLDSVKPNIAIISAGNENSFSHPRNSVLQRLFSADVYRTILTSFGTSSIRIRDDVRSRVAVYQNDVVITTNGDSYTISTSRSYHADKNCVADPGGCSNGLD